VTFPTVALIVVVGLVLYAVGERWAAARWVRRHPR